MKRRSVNQSNTLVDITLDKFDDGLIDTIKAKYPMISVGRSESNRFYESLGNNLKFFISHFYFPNAQIVADEIKSYYDNYDIKVKSIP